MKVKVCDAICGAGKTMSCINMMNSDLDNKYIFITPYLDEVERIKNSCVSRGFVAPEKKYSNKFSKLRDLPSLIRAGKNIVSTHALFASFTDEIKELIRKQGYILVLDEVIDLFQPVGIDINDVEFLKRKEVISQGDDGEVVWEDEAYKGVAYKEVQRLSKSRDMVNYCGEFYFWVLPVDIFECFSAAYVLTYLFEYQLLKHFFDIYHIEYELIGTTKKNGVYQFCPLGEMDRKLDLRKKVHIVMDSKLNKIGNENFSLSAGWFKRAAEEDGQPKLKTLKNNLYNYFRRKEAKPGNKLWSTFIKRKQALKGQGYANSFLSFNCRASNSYADKQCLAYCVNIYMMPWVRNYIIKLGADKVNQDMYALSIMIQWLFRSAIRKGEEIWVYIPSARMRYLLRTWLNNLARGKDLKSIKFEPQEALSRDRINDQIAERRKMKNKNKGVK